MSCGDVVPNIAYLPACGLEILSIDKTSSPLAGSLILPGDVITWTFLIQSRADAPVGIIFEDIFNDLSYVENLAVSAGWTLTVDPGNPLRYTVENPTAVHPNIYVCTMTATAGDSISGPNTVGFGTVLNEANALTPSPVVGNSVELIFGPQLVGVVGDKNLGEVVAYQYAITSGTAPFTVSLYLGELPPGLAISPTGLLSGTTTTPGSYYFTLQLLDGNGNIYLLPDTCEVTSLSTLVEGNDEAVEADSMTLIIIAMS